MTTSQYDLRIDQTAAHMRVCLHCCIIFDKKVHDTLQANI